MGGEAIKLLNSEAPMSAWQRPALQPVSPPLNLSFQVYKCLQLSTGCSLRPGQLAYLSLRGYGARWAPAWRCMLTQRSDASRTVVLGHFSSAMS